MTAGEGRVVEQPRTGSAAKLLNAAWLRPFLLPIFIVKFWDLAVRLFRIPPYQIPTPAEFLKEQAR
jgi:NitT/TauT family transport system permease protein